MTSPPVVRLRSRTLDDSERAAAHRALSASERTRFRKLDGAGADSFLAGRLLLRELAGELLGFAAADVQLAADCLDCGEAHGRPMIAGSQLRVSLSRTASLVVAAATWDRAVGIDIEAGAGSSVRLDAIEALSGTRSLRHWTRVESVVKADGRGLRVDPRRVRVTSRGSRVHAAIDGSPVRYRLLDLSFDDGTIGSLAVER